MSEEQAVEYLMETLRPLLPEGTALVRRPDSIRAVLADGRETMVAGRLLTGGWSVCQTSDGRLMGISAK